MTTTAEQPTHVPAAPTPAVPAPAGPGPAAPGPAAPGPAAPGQAAANPAAEFPAADEQQWQRLALRSLARSRPGADLDSLVTLTDDGIPIQPLYTGRPGLPPIGAPGQAPFVRGGRPDPATGWELRVQHGPGDPAEVRAAIAEDLDGGATSLWLTLETGAAQALPELLADLPLDRVPVVLDAGPEAAAAAGALLALAGRRGLPPARLRGALGLDPLAARARTGQAVPLASIVAPAARCASQSPGLRAVVVDGLVYQDAGGSDAEELGCVLAAAVAYLRLLTEAGFGPDGAAGQLEFRYGASADQFLTLAKLRAARLLWSQVTARCGRPVAQLQHAVTAWPTLTARQPELNILRGTLAAFGAAVGGAQAITVRPHDAALGRPTAAARRIARNTQLLLRDEAQLHRVLDPAGGSWYVEELTLQLARAAWDWFRQIERAGGMPAALDSGLVADRLARTRAERSRRVARHQEPITGVSAFPDLGEPAAALPAAEPVPAGALPRVRYAEPFERLRARVEARPDRALVFLAGCGPARGSLERQTLAAQLLGTAGIGTVAGSTGGGPEGIAGQFRAAPTSVACICPGGGEDREQLRDLVAALTAAGARRVWLAGRPTEYPGLPGVHFLFTGGDLLAALTLTCSDLSVP